MYTPVNPSFTMRLRGVNIIQACFRDDCLIISLVECTFSDYSVQIVGIYMFVYIFSCFVLWRHIHRSVFAFESLVVGSVCLALTTMQYRIY